MISKGISKKLTKIYSKDPELLNYRINSKLSEVIFQQLDNMKNSDNIEMKAEHLLKSGFLKEIIELGELYTKDSNTTKVKLDKKLYEIVVSQLEEFKKSNKLDKKIEYLLASGFNEEDIFDLVR